jgi:hypothetical protein
MDSDMETIVESDASSQVSDVDLQDLEAEAEATAAAEAAEAAIEEATSPEDDDTAADLFHMLEGKNWVTIKPDYNLVRSDRMWFYVTPVWNGRARAQSIAAPLVVVVVNRSTPTTAATSDLADVWFQRRKRPSIPMISLASCVRTLRRSPE